MYFCVLVDRQKLGPRKHWHTHHWNLGEKPGSKKVSPDRCFPWAGLDRRNWRCKHSVTLFQRYYRDTSTWNLVESSFFKATEPFNVSYIDLSEYSISVQYYLAISFPKSIRSWSRGTKFWKVPVCSEEHILFVFFREEFWILFCLSYKLTFVLL